MNVLYVSWQIHHLENDGPDTDPPGPNLVQLRLVAVRKSKKPPTGWVTWAGWDVMTPSIIYYNL